MTHGYSMPRAVTPEAFAPHSASLAKSKLRVMSYKEATLADKRMLYFFCCLRVSQTPCKRNM